MTELAEAPLSTEFEPDTASTVSGAGAPRTLEPEAKVSLRDTIAGAVKATDEAEPKPEAPAPKAEKGAEKPADGKEPPEPKEAAKPAERAPDGKFAAKAKEEGAEPDGKDAQPEVKAEAKPNGHIEPPSKFLPDAKEKWVNTPRSVQRDVENMAREHEAELTRHRESAERYEPIRQYDELARQNGRAGAHESLAEVVRLENLMQQNPMAALNQILMQAGPRKADGQPVSLFELAQVIVQQGQQGYQKMVAQPASQQPAQNDNPRIQQLEQQINRMQEQQLASQIIEPFRAAHPRYDELQGDIAFFLKSDKIPTSLSPHDRLEAAYDMAVRINPASQSAARAQADPDPGDRAVDDLSGSKSIKSAPGAVSPDMEPDRGGSTRDILRDQLRRSKLS